MIASRLSFIKPVILQIGSSRTIVIGEGRKTLIDEPACIATSLITNEVVGFGSKASRLRTSGSTDIEVNPLFWQGIPLDPEKTLAYVYTLRKKLSTSLVGKVLPLPVVPVIAARTPTPYVQMFLQTLREANFLIVATVSQLYGEFNYAVGSAVGTSTVLVVRMGESLTQIGLYTAGTQIYTNSLPIGGYDFDRWLQLAIHSKYSLTVSTHSLSTLKEDYTKAKINRSQFSAVLRGKDTHTGVLRSVQLSAQDIGSVSHQFFEHVASLVCFQLRSYQEVIAATHPTVSIFLSGGLSLIPEAKTSFATLFGREPELVSRPHIASALGAASVVAQKNYE
jgi:rod shape-determining protein MreB and related proteins